MDDVQEVSCYVNALNLGVQRINDSQRHSAKTTAARHRGRTGGGLAVEIYTENLCLTKDIDMGALSRLRR